MDNETKKLIRTKFLAFAIKAFAKLNHGRSLGREPYLRHFAHTLESVERGTIPRLAVSLPPRTGKTFLGSICFSAWILAHDPSAKILIVSYGQELADKIAFAIRAILESDWFQATFATRLKRKKLVDFVTTAGGVVHSTSIHAGVTGIGADYIIVDDAVEIKDCENVKRLDRVNRIFDDEIKTRLDNPKRGRIVIIAHRISEDDLTGHILQKHKPKKKGQKRRRVWHELKLPLVAPRDRNYELGDGKVWCRKKGDVLRPDAFSARDIEELRAGKLPGFETLQQQNPGAHDCLRIKSEYFGTFEPAGLPLSGIPRVLSIDPGQKSGPSNSFHVVQAWAASAKNFYLLDQWREHATYAELLSAVRRFRSFHHPSAILIEDTGLGPALRSDLRPWPNCELVKIIPLLGKGERLRRHRLTIRKNRIWLPADALWKQDFLDEAVIFPYGPFDDQIDALSQYLDFMKPGPDLKVPPSRALIARATNPSTPQIGGCVVKLNRDRYVNEPFPEVTVRVIY